MTGSGFLIGEIISGSGFNPGCFNLTLRPTRKKQSIHSTLTPKHTWTQTITINLIKHFYNHTISTSLSGLTMNKCNKIYICILKYSITYKIVNMENEQSSNKCIKQKKCTLT